MNKRFIVFLSSRKSWTLPYIIFSAIFVIIPLFLIVVYAFTDDSGHLTLANFQKFFEHPEAINTFVYSIGIAIITTLVCILLGYPAAWILSNSKLNRSKTMVVLFILPMWVNILVRTLATVALFDFFSVPLGEGALIFGMVYNFIPFMIYPIFVIEGENIKNPIPSMPGVFQYSVDRMDEMLAEVAASGIAGVLIFGIPKEKDAVGSQAYAPDGITQRAIRHIKKKYPSLLVVADVCLCEYTSHGHCGLVEGEHILNDETLPLLAKMSVTLAQAGADIIAPSDMMDGRVAAIRHALDEAGLLHIPIMAYSAKFASGYYGPFRDAAHSAPQFGDRRSYQMDVCNKKEALREIADDIEEGADFYIIKPALAYLDVVEAAANRFDLPIAVYNVSGEYAMVKAAAQQGWIEEKRIVMENLIAMKRAGASILITYHALDAASWLKED